VQAIEAEGRGHENLEALGPAMSNRRATLYEVVGSVKRHLELANHGRFVSSFPEPVLSLISTKARFVNPAVDSGSTNQPIIIIARLLSSEPWSSTAAKSTREKEPTTSSNQPGAVPKDQSPISCRLRSLWKRGNPRMAGRSERKKEGRSYGLALFTHRIINPGIAGCRGGVMTTNRALP
jgi:hypothetical protein